MTGHDPFYNFSSLLLTLSQTSFKQRTEYQRNKYAVASSDWNPQSERNS